MVSPGVAVPVPLLMTPVRVRTPPATAPMVTPAALSSMGPDQVPSAVNAAPPLPACSDSLMSLAPRPGPFRMRVCGMTGPPSTTIDAPEETVTVLAAAPSEVEVVTSRSPASTLTLPVNVLAAPGKP